MSSDVITTTSRVRKLVDAWADRLIIIATRADEKQTAGGVKALRDAILDSLDVGDFGDPEQRDVLEDARVFCISHCPESEQDGPGRSTRCIRCPLKYHALTRYEETTEELAREATEERLAELQGRQDD